IPAHVAVDEFRCTPCAPIRREAGRGLAARLLGRHGRTGAQLRPYEGSLSAADRERRASGRVADPAGGARNLLGPRAMAPVELSVEIDPRPGASVARIYAQHQVESDSGGLEDRIRRVPEADWLSLRPQEAGRWEE